MSHKRVASSPEIVIDVKPAPPGGGGGGGGGGARRGALFHADGQPTTFFKTCCLSALLFSTVCGTLLAEASKVDGTRGRMRHRARTYLCFRNCRTPPCVLSRPTSCRSGNSHVCEQALMPGRETTPAHSLTQASTHTTRWWFP